MSVNISNQAYDIVTENELANVLSHYSTEFVISVVQEAMKKRYSEYPYINLPNVVHSWEANFKMIMEHYKDLPETREEVLRVRDITYIEIINTICSEFGLQKNIDDVDLYSAASVLYDFFVCNFSENMVNFFTFYLNREKNTIYDYMDFNERKKQKDSTTIYGKRLFKDPKLAIINANIDEVINAMAAFDITLVDIFNLIPDSYTSIFMKSIISTEGDFYKTSYISLLNTHLRADYLTAIRLKLQSIATVIATPIENQA